jgi:hypothetical protein
MCKRKNEDSQMKREEYERQMSYCDQVSNTNIHTNTIQSCNSNINNIISYQHASNAQLFGRQFVRANRRSVNANVNSNVHQTNSNYSAQGGH